MKLFCLLALFSCAFMPLSSYAEAKKYVWLCTPLHWVNLRNDGADINPGIEPSFSMTIIDTKATISGKGSWLDRSEFHFYEKLELGDTFLKAETDYKSSLIFNITKGEFVYSSTNPSLAVSMAGKCEMFVPQ